MGRNLRSSPVKDSKATFRSPRGSQIRSKITAKETEKVQERKGQKRDLPELSKATPTKQSRLVPGASDKSKTDSKTSTSGRTLRSVMTKGNNVDKETAIPRSVSSSPHHKLRNKQSPHTSTRKTSTRLLGNRRDNSEGLDGSNNSGVLETTPEGNHKKVQTSNQTNDIENRTKSVNDTSSDVQLAKKMTLTEKDEISDEDQDIREMRQSDVLLEPAPKVIKLQQSTNNQPRQRASPVSKQLVPGLDPQVSYLQTVLAARSEEIRRLRNELKWKDKQLEDMQQLSMKNMELEARIAALLADEKVYQQEVEKYNRSQSKPKIEHSYSHKEQNKQDEKNSVECHSSLERSPRSTLSLKPRIVLTPKKTSNILGGKSKTNETGRKDDAGGKESVIKVPCSTSPESEQKQVTDSVTEEKKENEIFEVLESSEEENQERLRSTRQSVSGSTKKELTKRPSKKSKSKKGNLGESDTEIVNSDSDASRRKDKRKAKGSSKEKTTNAKGRRLRRRKRKEESEEEEEEEDIETMFVQDVSEDDEDEEEKGKQGKKLASPEKKKDGSESESDEGKTPKGRHNIRKIITTKKLAKETKVATKEEKERIERAKKEHEKHHIRVDETDKKSKAVVTKKLVLAVDENRKPLVEVNKDLIKKLKPHQVDAVEFMWDSCIESLQRLKSDDKGSGCILAHCMGLGKTLSVITLVHTLLTNKVTGMKTCLVVCPLNTVLNWQHEFNKWLAKKDRLKVHELVRPRSTHTRCTILKKWQEEGGVIIMGYQLFRHLVRYSGKSQKRKKTLDESLLNPGPDLVVCDEGHILKNDQSILSRCMNQICSKRRIVLTGTPLQNNLIEYHCMVNFVKANLLGTRKEFGNRFVNPITNGQHLDSTPRDVKIMRRRAHVLHEMLAGCVQRRDYSALTKFLTPKHEYVISVRLSEVQMELYQKYLDMIKSPQYVQQYGSGAGLFVDYQNLMYVWTHPWSLKLAEMRQERKQKQINKKKQAVYNSDSESDEDDEEESLSDTEETDNTEDERLSLDDESEISEAESEVTFKPRSLRSQRKLRSDQNEKEEKTSGPSSQKTVEKDEAQTGARPTVSKDKESVEGKETVMKKASSKNGNNGRESEKPPKWWSAQVTGDMEDKMELSGKLVLLFDILRMAETLGDKVLVFSQSILSLDLIEAMLAVESAAKESSKKKKGKANCKWVKGEDYYRMDGSTCAGNRKKMVVDFNDKDQKRMRLFLISTRAGGLGINLEAANRVVIFDASWNPSNDIQSIFRVYRFGQVKSVYVYRFLAQGTMEEKIYERQVIKETLAQRVIDEHQIDRHFNADDLQELYSFRPDRLDDPNRKERETPAVPKDLILMELLSSRKEWVCGYHEHDSLLENHPEENLSEEERKAAWQEYEQEKNAISTYRTYTWTAPLNPGVGLPSTSQVVKPVPVGEVKPLSFAKAPTRAVDTNQIPRVVQEIMKYNPNITQEELQSRLSAFLGMHSSFKMSNLQVGPTNNTAQVRIIKPNLPPGVIPGTNVPTTTATVLVPFKTSAPQNQVQGSGQGAPVPTKKVYVISGPPPQHSQQK